jgi:hypothetical protein
MLGLGLCDWRMDAASERASPVVGAWLSVWLGRALRSEVTDEALESRIKLLLWSCLGLSNESESAVPLSGTASCTHRRASCLSGFDALFGLLELALVGILLALLDAFACLVGVAFAEGVAAFFVEEAFLEEVAVSPVLFLVETGIGMTDCFLCFPAGAGGAVCRVGRLAVRRENTSLCPPETEGVEPL